MRYLNLKNINKKFIIIGVMVLVIALIFAMFEPSIATNRMPGVEKLVGDISSSPDTEKYSVLEIVPAKGAGEIGYSIEQGASEYFDAKLIDAMENETLSDDPNYSNARSAAYDELILKLQNNRICAPNESLDTTDYAIFRSSTEAYQETYFKNNAEANWHRLIIPEELRLTSAVNGNYELVAQGEGSYSFDVDGSDNKVIVGFRLADTDEQGLYKLEFDSKDAVQASNPDNLKYGGYSLVDINETPLDLSDDVHVKTSLGSESLEVDYILSTEEKSIDSESTDFKYLPIYSYSYDPNGDYEFIQSDDIDAYVNHVEIGEVYYNLNITSNEWFKKKVFGLELGTDTFDNFNIEVTSITPAELNAAYAINENIIDDYDFLYIYGEAINPYSENTTDMDYSLMATIQDRINSESLATVVNSEIFQESILSDASYINNSYIYKLSVLALLNDYAAPLVEPTDTEWNENYASLFISRYSSFFSEANGSFIVNNVYSHGSYYSLASDYLFDKDFAKSMDGSVYSITTPYEDMITFINDENLIRDVEDQLSFDISTSTILQYVISVNALSPISIKTKIKILDIEPAKSVGLTKDMVKSWNTDLNYQDDDIEIVKMTSYEFIGKIEDIKEEYDLVYLGLDTGNLNTLNGETVYNDSNLNGKIYLHTGDAVYCDRMLLGMLDEGEPYGHDYYSSIIYGIKVNSIFDYSFNNDISSMNDNIGVFRYSGNDITRIKADELIDYVNAGFPIVLDSKFKGTNNSGKSYLDTTSNMNYLYQNISGTVIKDSVFYEDELQEENENFKRYLVKPKVILNLLNQTDLEYPNKINDAAIVYNFNIDNDLEFNSETRYTVELYFDLNADGRYEEDSEKQSELIFKNSEGDIIDADEFGNYLLESNKNYTVTRNIPTSYSGPITWKLVAKVSGDTGCDSITDTTEVIPVINDLYLKEVDILHIKADGDTNTLDLATALADGEYWHEDMEKYGYDINITSVSISDFTANYNQYLGENSSFDMLVIGFADCWNEMNNTAAIKSISEFISLGKSVLFTHDTLSFINYPLSAAPNDNTYWGYNINSILRTQLGMDRYGVSQRNSENTDFSGMAQLLRRGEVVNNPIGILSEANDIAYVVDNKNYSYPEIRGFTNSLLDNLFEYSNDYYSLNDPGIPINSDLVTMDHIVNKITEENTNYFDSSIKMFAKQINSGQITKFPYDLENETNELSIAPSHFQYYQLDLENKDSNGNCDTVVWYTIGGEKDSQGDQIATPYSAYPNDVRNNYYLYSKDNIMYSGIGHSTIDYNDYNNEEFKLFLNTIIATYRMVEREPVLTIQSEESINSNERGAFCFAYDDINSVSEIPINGNESIYFNVNNPNIMGLNNSFTVSYEYQNDNGSYQQINCSTKLISGSEEISVNNDEILSGRVYKMVLPSGAALYDYMNDNNTGRIKVKIVYSYDLYGETYTGELAKEVLLTKMNLYNLQ